MKLTNNKGIILAGGLGTRLYPTTKSISKHLMPIYDKPMIYYPLSVLMLAGISEVLIITTPQDQNNFKNLLGNGEDFGINIQYAIQNHPRGLADAFIVGKEFIGQSSVCLILGDNIFFGQGLSLKLKKAILQKNGATIFAYRVKDPKLFGVVEIDRKQKVKSLAEKPKVPKSDYAVTGLYFYDNDVVKIAQNIKPSNRGELEITDVNKIYLKRKKLNIELLGRGYAWLDTGSVETLLDAGNFIQTIEMRQGLKIACLEEIGYIQNWIKKDQISKQIKKMPNCSYRKYLNKILE
jgi:glucose-1-phosphate thymidylyltransferase